MSSAISELIELRSNALLGVRIQALSLQMHMDAVKAYNDLASVLVLLPTKEGIPGSATTGDLALMLSTKWAPVPQVSEFRSQSMDFDDGDSWDMRALSEWEDGGLMIGLEPMYLNGAPNLNGGHLNLNGVLILNPSVQPAQGVAGTSAGAKPPGLAGEGEGRNGAPPQGSGALGGDAHAPMGQQYMGQQQSTSATKASGAGPRGADDGPQGGLRGVPGGPQTGPRGADDGSGSRRGTARDSSGGQPGIPPPHSARSMAALAAQAKASQGIGVKVERRTSFFDMMGSGSGAAARVSASQPAAKLQVLEDRSHQKRRSQGQLGSASKQQQASSRQGGVGISTSLPLPVYSTASHFSLGLGGPRSEAQAAAGAEASERPGVGADARGGEDVEKGGRGAPPGSINMGMGEGKQQSGGVGEGGQGLEDLIVEPMYATTRGFALGHAASEVLSLALPSKLKAAVGPTPPESATSMVASKPTSRGKAAVSAPRLWGPQAKAQPAFFRVGGGSENTGKATKANGQSIQAEAAKKKEDSKRGPGKVDDIFDLLMGS
eukprot:gene17021-23311_t